MKIISVVTATYNSSKTIPALIDSIRKSKSDKIEWIVIDGGSTDGTVSMLLEAGDVVDKMISEPDEGIYDAWNKGLRFVSGEYVCFIGSDDYLSEDYFSESIKAIDGKHNVIGFKVQLFDQDGPRLFLHDAEWQKPWDYPLNCGFHHQGTLYSIGLLRGRTFNKSYKIIGDAEMNYRIADFMNPKIHLTSNPLIYFSLRGISSDKNNFLRIYDEKIRLLMSVAQTYKYAYFLVAVYRIKKRIRLIIGKLTR